MSNVLNHSVHVVLLDQQLQRLPASRNGHCFNWLMVLRGLYYMPSPGTWAFARKTESSCLSATSRVVMAGMQGLSVCLVSNQHLYDSLCKA